MCWPVGKSERRYAGVTHIDVSKMDADAVRRVQDLMSAKGVEISGLGYYPNPLTPDRAEAETYIAHIRKVIEAAQALLGSVVNTFIGMRLAPFGRRQLAAVSRSVAAACEVRRRSRA